MSIEKARKIVAAIEDANDRAHGAATAWCPDEAVELIAAALSAAHAEPVWVVVKQFHGEVSTYDVGSFVRVTSIYNGNATIEPVAGRGCVVGVPLDRLKRTSLYAAPSEAAIRADEREKCAKVAEHRASEEYRHAAACRGDEKTNYLWAGDAATEVATAIRARGD